MKTEQAIIKLGQTLWDILGREYIDKYCEDKNGNLVSVSTISVDGIAEELVNAGYGDVSEYKAEREMLGSQIKVLKQRLNNKYVEIERLRTTLGQCNTELNSAFESLKSQCREIGELKAGVKQAKIDVLNELKKRARTSYVLDDFVLGSVVFSKDIDELIKEVQNG